MNVLNIYTLFSLVTVRYMNEIKEFSADICALSRIPNYTSFISLNIFKGENAVSRINSFIEGYMSGNAWEDLCVQCYRIRYQKDNYTAIPATQGGDAGIEGFTYKGVVHQCYCPERDYSDNELYEHQRNKLTADIEKLKKNADRLKALGVPPVVEWHFNIPEN